MEAKKIKLERRVSVRETLRGILVGESRSIRRSDIPVGSIRSAIVDLNKCGYKYKLNDSRANSTVVTRLL